MNERKDVNTQCILISSLWEEAQQIKEALPPGRAHVCLQTSELPMAINKILKASLRT